MTRKQLARESGVSERYLAEIEGGTGNISVLILRRVADALGETVDALLSESPEPPVELVHTVEFLRRLRPDELVLAQQLLLQQFGGEHLSARHRRIALIGLRGAGKSTIGAAIAERLNLPFVELDQVIRKKSGLTLDLVFDFHGQAGFRRLERQCLDELLADQSRFVLATSGSIVSEPGTFERLLSSCMTIWVSALPEEHMQRVIAQGDMRPMADNRDAMSDLKRILKARESLYRKADVHLDTSGRTPEDCVDSLLRSLEEAMVRDAPDYEHPDGTRAE
jgi:XRE family aerobic/anaerobic benzoate catabolism transcriptional regulator